MTEMQYTTVDRVLSKFHRDLRGTTVNESDMIEWIGEALGFLKVYQIQEEAVAFLEVKNYETNVPDNFNMVIQIARKNNWVKENSCEIIPEAIEEHKSVCGCKKEECILCNNPLYCDFDPVDFINKFEQDFYEFRFNFRWSFNSWNTNEWHRRNFTPVRLSNHSFFNSVVCKETDRDLYSGCQDEYTIVGTTNKKLRFSFKEGLVALSYLRTAIDDETGYPLIPDNESYMAAITYYIKWKIAEWYQWNGREGFQQTLPGDLERKWLKYARQAKNYMKMPKSADEYQNMMEQTYTLPNLYRYDNYFGGQAPRNQHFIK